MLKEYKAFIMRGNVLDLAIGIIIGVAFGAVVNSAVKDVIMPPIGLAMGRVDFANLFALLTPGKTPPPYASLAEAQTAGAVTINYGFFINTIISFLIIVMVIFFIVRAVNRASQPKPAAAAAPTAPTSKECPYCLSVVPIKASRCGHCTSQL